MCPHPTPYLESTLTDQNADGTLRGPDDLLAPFHDAITHRSRFRVGTEAEKFGVQCENGEPLAFDGERGIARVLELLVERHGWFAESEHQGGTVISLHRGDASITLEPAAQLELSGAPYASVHEASTEILGHLAELRDISKELNIAWLSLGFHPFADHAALPHVPKSRYAIMREYMPSRGARSLDMMRRTCTVQANLDFESEADAMRKLRLSLAAQPITTAMFANSPLLEGVRAAHLSERAATWLEMDVDRSGMLPFALSRGAGFEDYVQWALDVPMFLVKRGARLIRNTGQSFRSFMRDGAEGERATMNDWETHLNSLFPEARLKRTLEVRGADAQPTDLVCAVPALWKGLLYDPQAMDALEGLVEPLTADSLSAARADIARRGLAAELLGRSVQGWAQELLEIADAGLQRQCIMNGAGECEAIYLQPLARLVEAGTTPAETLLAGLPAGDVPRDRVIELTRI